MPHHSRDKCSWYTSITHLGGKGRARHFEIDMKAEGFAQCAKTVVHALFPFNNRVMLFLCCHAFTKDIEDIRILFNHVPGHYESHMRFDMHLYFPALVC